MPVLIRPFEPRDRDGVAVLYRAAWHATYDSVDGADRINAVIAALLEGDKPEMFDLAAGDVPLVAQSGSGIVGGIRAHPRPDAVHISGFYVAPVHVRRGIGAALFTHLTMLFTASIIRADVRPTSMSALAFYGAHGFVEIGRGCADVGGGHWVETIELQRAAT